MRADGSTIRSIFEQIFLDGGHEGFFPAPRKRSAPRRLLRPEKTIHIPLKDTVFPRPGVGSPAPEPWKLAPRYRLRPILYGVPKMRDECAHVVRNAVPRARALLINARLSLRRGRLEEAEQLLKGIETSLREVDEVYTKCPGGCCAKGGAN